MQAAKTLRSLAGGLVGWIHRAAGLCLLLLVSASCTTLAAQQFTVTGTVRDTTRAVIAGAEVTLRSPQSTQSTKTGPDGGFVFSGVPGLSGTVRVTANSFAPAEQEWSATSEPIRLTFVLRGLAQGEQVVVSATRTEMKLSEVPGSAVLLSPTDVDANPALTLDDLLRQVPGFSLFRRSSSRVANPTTQGVSLRGLGASGPSRALVLEDGVPMVDPFGGWVYWDRIPRTKLASVEVVRGGASSLYGSDALGGVVQFLSRVPTGPSISIDTSYGTEDTPDLSVWAGTAISRWDLEAAADMSRTDGYILVPAYQRGAVDTLANSKHATVDAAVGYRVSESGRAFLRGGFFDESRNNGTPVTYNSTGTGFGAAGINTALGSHDSITARVFGLAQGYDQTFSSVAPNRSKETLTDIQHVPSQQIGTAVQWEHVLRGHTLIAGLDIQEVLGASDEQLVLVPADNVAGGRQRSSGIFGQDIFRFGSKWTFIAGVRWDDWRNFNGSTVRISLPSRTATTRNFADRSESAFSPSLSLMRALTSNLSLSLSGYRAFRAPTLNELYRSFRQGNALTNSNPLLRAERLTGAEAGLKATTLGGKVESRGTVFWSDIVDPVTNVTLSTTPTLITRQRQNLGRTRSLGAELDGVVYLSTYIEISGGYQYVHATVVGSSAVLVGKNVPEVPRHQFTWEARYWNPTRLMLSVQGRYTGTQYDDDMNTLLLTHYHVTDLFLGRQFRGGVTFYVAVENLFNRRYPVTLTPPAPNIASLGPPILARVGIRYEFPGK
jgi:outer membrane receptor protein involved in Fe transport